MKIKFIAIISFIALALVCCTGTRGGIDPTEVKTASGRVRGYIQDSVLVFKGVPYASAERFLPAHDHAKWDTVMDCTEFGPIAPQVNLRKKSSYNPSDTAIFMSEDCLNLNIWTSMRNDGGNRPVMVWIHGGGFDNGHSHVNLAADGVKLAINDNVVLVTLNHRLNVLGHLDLSAYGPEYTGSGNLAMTDIIQALKWIRNNIAAFGGDPGNVTLFGHGSGGVKVLTLMGMYDAKGLFHKAIVQSGTLNGMTQPQNSSRRIAELTMEEAGVKDVDGLRQLSYDSLQHAATRAIERTREEFKRDPEHLIKFAPVIDGITLKADLFSDTCISVSLDVPVIIGSTFSEYSTYPYIIGNSANFNHGGLSQAQIDSALQARYGNNAQAIREAFTAAYPERPLHELLTMDTNVRSRVLQMAHMLARRGNAPVYVYLFNWVSPLDNGIARSFRSSELPFVFNNYESAEFSRAGGDEARRLARIMSRCWTSFARSGNPNNSITPFWRRINSGEEHTMIFGRDIHLVGYPDLELMQLLEPERTGDIILYNQ